MGYRIEYDFQQIRKISVKGSQKPTGIGRSLLCLFCGVLICYGLFVLVELWVTGQTQNASAASEMLVDHLKAGSDLQDAIAAFCDGLVQ